MLASSNGKLSLHIAARTARNGSERAEAVVVDLDDLGKELRQAHPFTTIVLLAAVLAGLDLAAIVVAHFGALLAVAGVGVVIVYGYRRARRPAPPRVIQDRTEPASIGTCRRGVLSPCGICDGVDQLRAERDQLAAAADDLRRQVAKLEDDAARHD